MKGNLPGALIYKAGKIGVVLNWEEKAWNPTTEIPSSSPNLLAAAPGALMEIQGSVKAPC